MLIEFLQLTSYVPRYLSLVADREEQTRRICYFREMTLVQRPWQRGGFDSNRIWYGLARECFVVRDVMWGDSQLISSNLSLRSIYKAFNQGLTRGSCPEDAFCGDGCLSWDIPCWISPRCACLSSLIQTYYVEIEKCQ